jgi:hypothetical protein
LTTVVFFFASFFFGIFLAARFFFAGLCFGGLGTGVGATGSCIDRGLLPPCLDRGLETMMYSYKMINARDKKGPFATTIDNPIIY